MAFLKQDELVHTNTRMRNKRLAGEYNTTSQFGDAYHCKVAYMEIPKAIQAIYDYKLVRKNVFLVL